MGNPESLPAALSGVGMAVPRVLFIRSGSSGVTAFSVSEIVVSEADEVAVPALLIVIAYWT